MVDNLSRGRQESLPRDVPLVRMDIRDPIFSSVIADFRPEVIIHQAAQVDVVAAVADPVEDASVI